jgi:hypothetical protein
MPTADALVILIPVFNDWPAVALLLRKLDSVLEAHHLTAGLLLIDDASSEPPAPDFPGGPFQAIVRTEILELRRNLGHQRALAIGLAHIHEHIPCEAVLIMDGDGEDAPEDVPRLLEKYKAEGGRCVVFAQRLKRSESAVFKFCYRLYRYAHLVLTGHAVRVGNFSLVPFAAVQRLVAVEELWNHYAAAVFHARLPRVEVPTHRARRLAGKPRMNFVALLLHGLSAISVFGDIVGARLLGATAAIILLTLLGLAGVVVVRTTTDLAIPGWATTVAGLLLVVLLQAIMISLIFIFILLNGRKSANFLPIRDYRYFVLRVRSVA